MKITPTILVLVFALFSLTTTAQYTIDGTVRDENNIPLTFANVLVYKDAQETPITAMATNEQGAYIFENLEAGTYQLEVSMLGFKTKKSEKYVLSDAQSMQNINFSLALDQLDEVVITAKKPIIKQTAEKIIVDISASSMINTNVQDVMKKIPGVIVNNGNLNYAGQSNIRILINGKSTDYMDITSLLREMPADNIAKVELIQQPGAEYDAQGAGPLINIILKKNVKLGTHGNLRSTVGYNDDWLFSTGTSIASYKNKLNWQAAASYSKNAWRDDLQITRAVLDETYDQTSLSPYDPENINLSGRLDYYLSTHSSLGLSLRSTQSDSERITDNRTTISDMTSEATLFTDNLYDKQWTTYIVNPYYEYENDKNKVVVDVNYVNYDSNNENNLLEIGESIVDFSNQRFFQDVTYNIYTVQGDYKRTFSDDFIWRVGGKYTTVDSDSNLQSFIQNDQGSFENNLGQTNRFLIDEEILAVYSKIDVGVKKWNFSAGLRWEESDTKGTSMTLDEIAERHIAKFFPSVTVSRELTEEIAVNVAYSYRISRPSYSSLNSFVYYYDPFTFEEGNPSLKPSLTHSFQLNLTYDKQPFFSVAYRDTSDELFQILSQNDGTGETSRSMINIENHKNWNFRLFAPINIIDGLDGFTGIIANYNAYNARGLDPMLDISKWNFMWYTSAEYTLPWDITSEVTGYYTTGGLEGQIDYEWLAGLDIAISKAFLKDKLKVSLEWEEILDRQFVGAIDYDNISATIQNDWSRRNVYLQLNYSFGTGYTKKKKRSNASEDAIDRINTQN